MAYNQAEVDRFLRQVLLEVASRVGIEGPEYIESSSDLPELIHARDQKQLRQVMEMFRSTYRRWYDKNVELENAENQGGDMSQLRMELIGLIKERDLTRDAMIRYLDHYYPAKR